MDDARHTMMLSRTAAHYGAAVASSTRVVGFVRDEDRVTGARVRDLESGREIDIRARQMINATGVWIDEIQADAGRARPVPGPRVQGYPPAWCRGTGSTPRCGLITRTEKSLLFVIPWHSHWMIGTTDTDWSLDLRPPGGQQADIDYLLGQANRLLADPLTRDDVVGVYAGLRPLLSGESDSTSKLSREHAVASPVRGPDRDRRRQVHDLPGDGQGRRRRGRPRAEPGPAA